MQCFKEANNVECPYIITLLRSKGKKSGDVTAYGFHVYITASLLNDVIAGLTLGVCRYMAPMSQPPTSMCSIELGRYNFRSVI